MRTQMKFGSYKKICPDDMIALIGDINYTFAHLQNGKVLLAAITLKKFEKKLNPQKFCRVHRSCLVNMDYVVGFNGHEIELSNAYSSIMVIINLSTFY